MGTWQRDSERRPTALRSAELRANASAAMAAVLFGASVVAVRVAVRDVPPISLAVLRIGLAGLLLAGILLLVAPWRLRVSWDRLRLLGLLGLVLFTLFPLTFNIGLQYTEASRGAVMLATMPIWSAVLGRIVGDRLTRHQVEAGRPAGPPVAGERPAHGPVTGEDRTGRPAGPRVGGERLTGRQVVGVGLSVVGIGLAFVEPGRSVAGGAASLVGDGLLLLTGLLGAVYGLLARRALAVDSAATVTTYAMLWGTLLLLPAAVVEGLVPAIVGLDWRLLGLVAFLAVLGGAAAFLLWTWALTRLTPTRVAVYVNLNPIVAALLGIVLLDERRSAQFLLGFVAVVTGVLLVNWPDRGRDG